MFRSTCTSILLSRSLPSSLRFRAQRGNRFGSPALQSGRRYLSDMEMRGRSLRENRLAGANEGFRCTRVYRVLMRCRSDCPLPPWMPLPTCRRERANSRLAVRDSSGSGVRSIRHSSFRFRRVVLIASRGCNWISENVTPRVTRFDGLLGFRWLGQGGQARLSASAMSSRLLCAAGRGSYHGMRFERRLYSSTSP